MSLKKLVNDKILWDAFGLELDALIGAEHKTLESLSDPMQMHRSQGKIQAYRNLKYLRDKVNGSK
jgi:hypothetical protein|tara:strand:- start:2330 stop:2524 length:195 start_codon:yes stop_codon:yes gene_type:complete